MAIADGKKRVVLTFPEDSIDAFKADARRLNMSLSAYAYLVLGSMSTHLDESESDYMCDHLNFIQERIWEREHPEKWEAIKESSKRISDKTS